MVPITLVSRFTQCPRCRLVLRRGMPRFGPSQVKCGKCGLVIDMPLNTWAELPFFTKLFTAFGEIIAPSRLGVFFYALISNFLLHVIFGSFFGCGLYMLWPSGLSAEQTNGLVWALVCFLAFLIITLPIIRLILLIRESNEYSATGIPPVWKAGIF